MKMNKRIKPYLKCLEETLSSKYDIPKDISHNIVLNSYVIDSLVEYPEESLHDDIETVADNIYEEWIEMKGEI